MYCNLIMSYLVLNSFSKNFMYVLYIFSCSIILYVAIYETSHFFFFRNPHWYWTKMVANSQSHVCRLSELYKNKTISYMTFSGPQGIYAVWETAYRVKGLKQGIKQGVQGFYLGISFLLHTFQKKTKTKPFHVHSAKISWTLLKVQFCQKYFT